MLSCNVPFWLEVAWIVRMQWRHRSLRVLKQFHSKPWWICVQMLRNQKKTRSSNDRRKFRSQTSVNMYRWKVEKKERRESQKKEKRRITFFEWSPSVTFLPGMCSDIPPGILFGLPCGILFDIFLTYILANFLAYILAFYLAYTLTYVLPFCRTLYLSNILAFYFTVEVQRRSLRSDGGGWGPTVLTAILSWRRGLARSLANRIGETLGKGD